MFYFQEPASPLEEEALQASSSNTSSSIRQKCLTMGEHSKVKQG